jgi:hypothetical protein
VSDEIRQGTATAVVLEAFADASDALTEETGLAGTMTVKLVKYGAGSAVSRNSATAITHLGNGRYRVPLDTTDTNTLGPLRVSVYNSSVHMPVWEYVQVVSQQFWDSKYSTDKLQVDVVETGSTDAVTGNSDLKADVSGLSTFDASSDGVIVDALTADGANDFYTVAATGSPSAATDSVVEGAQGSATEATVQDALTAQGYTTTRAPKLDYLDAAISGISGGALGPGGTTWTVATTVGGQPADNVAVWLTTDSAGAHVYAGPLYSDADGEVTFMVDNATRFFCWREKGGVNFTNPTVEDVP